MRLAVLVLSSLVATAAHAQKAQPLTERQAGFLHGMAAEMQAMLRHDHARKGHGTTYREPRVVFDRNRRQIVVVNRFHRNPKASVRRALKRSMPDRQPNLCLAFQSPTVRATGVTIVLRAEMRSGSPIASVRASADLCPL